MKRSQIVVQHFWRPVHLHRGHLWDEFQSDAGGLDSGHSVLALPSLDGLIAMLADVLALAAGVGSLDWTAHALIEAQGSRMPRR